MNLLSQGVWQMSQEEIRAAIKDEQIKRALKEAMREWLDEQFARFGRWSFYGLMSAGLVALVYAILTTSGWHK
jgi:hypothetical protein